MPTYEQPYETELWEDVEEALGMSVPQTVRNCCEQMGLVDEFSPTPEENVVILADAVKCLQENECYPTSQDGRPKPQDKAARPAEVPEDERWPLLADLGRAFDVKFRGMPVADEYHGFVPMTVRHYADTASYPPSQRIQIDFDARMSLATVLATIRREWKNRFKPQGWVHPTRRQGERAPALLRFVCLESPDTATWRERMEEWNERFPHWSFKDVRAFQAAFRRAEEQLTGRRKSLLALHTTKAAYKKRDKKWRQAHLARIQAMGQTREQLLEAKESE